MNGFIKTEISILAQLDGMVSLEVKLSPPFTDITIENLSETVSRFFSLAKLGTYVVETLSPTQSRVEVITERRNSDGIAWSFRAVGVDARVVQILRNILVVFSKLCHPVSFLSISSVDSIISRKIELPPLSARTPDETYPPKSQHLGFATSIKMPYSSNSVRRVEITFAEFLDDEKLKLMIERLELWSSVSLGAYATNESNVWSGDSVIFDALPDIMDDYTIEMPIEKFGAPEVAWNGLLNLCGWCSQNIVRITSVNIS